ncbi:Uncharacterised protein [Actinomyces bovis]|uniref:Transposase n=1 Tax=Actinomyces bovis TaxID=1658 RepID=A0ABY1VLC8_9ACTO|nr:hypothetical protein [Actinomyces bovis]SPT52472.1 Uncharacterised protein [Actinomyces bovis]VEG54157.1 Uncharacterised protein [Actinomyces israelii]
MKKSGRTAAGAQRWKCTAWRASTTAPRPQAPPVPGPNVPTAGQVEDLHDPLERTTNPVESVNAQVRDRLRHHRGTTTDHQAAIAESTLHTYTQAPATPAALLAHWTAQDRPQRTRTPKPTTSHPNTHPAGPGTTPTPEEGLWARKGWAGRTS